LPLAKLWLIPKKDIHMLGTWRCRDGEGAWTGLIWLRIGTGGGYL